MEKIITYIALLTLGLSSAIAQTSQDLSYLNQLRKQSGLSPFISHPALARAAKSHADYLSLHNERGHTEQKYRTLFSGEHASERALYAGYPNSQVSENVTTKSGDPSHYKPIDQLMSALYHRFAFLSFTKNEIGIGQQSGDISAFVYVMGNSSISALCSQASFTANGRYIYKICADRQHKIQQQTFEDTLNRQRLKQPPYTLWPAVNSQQIPTVFYEESPDPLPQARVSGYPISIEFNSAFFTQPPKVTRFELINLKTARPIHNKLLLNKNNDINHLLNAYQHALFPLQRLDWNTSYEVQLSYVSEHQTSKTIKWQFTTEKPAAKIITIKPNKRHYKIPINQTFLMYFPPNNENDVDTSMSYKDFGMNLQISYYDKNTLKLMVKNSGKAEIVFHHSHITIEH